MMRQFKKYIEDGLLSVLVCECNADSDQALLHLLVDSDADWVTMSTKGLVA